jgi:hypothetical protein
MNSKERFELAIEGYKDVSEQLRRWQNIQIASGWSKAEARKAAGKYLAPLDLFGFHRAYFNIEKGVPDAESDFERERHRFEAAILGLKHELSRAGVPIEPP